MLRKHPEVVYTDLDEGAVLLHMDTKFYYSLNETGSAIWRWLDATSDIEQLSRNLSAHFEVSGEEAHDTVARFLNELEKEELLASEEGGDGDASELEPPTGDPRSFVEPKVLKHDEPLHDVVTNPFDPQLPLAE